MELKVAMVYARGLYLLAEEREKTDPYREELKQIDRIFQEERRFMRLMTNPGINRTQKKDMIHNVFDGRISEDLISFLCLLIDHGRFAYLHKITLQYDMIEDNEEGVSEGVIVSAVPLRDEQIRKFEEETGKLLKRKVTLRDRIDGRILGGVKIFADGRLIDASVETRLEELTARIKNC